jgi:VWFA-related protein
MVTQPLFRSMIGVVLLLAPPRGNSQTPEPRMVDLYVVAVDSRGQPVTDLTSDELRITDSGQPQKIAYFRLRDGRRAPAPALAPNEFSNRGGNNIPRATLILFDLLNENFSTRAVAADLLIRSLESLEAPDYVYLYCLALNGRIFPVHGLPSPGATPEGAPWTHDARQVVNRALRALLQVRPPDIDDAVRVQITYTALDQIAAELSRIPGRKNIVWITDGVPIELGPVRSDTGDFVDFTPLLRRMSEAFERSGVAIYPVRQVMLGSPNNVNLDGTGPANTSAPQGRGAASTSTGMGSLDTLDQFAGMTGGRADGGKDIGAALRQAISDARTSYQVGYYPPEKIWDDKYHKIRVTSTRKGLRIQARTGYYGWREAPGARTQDAIDSAIATSFDAAEIGLRASLTPDPKGSRTLRLEAHIDARDVASVPAGQFYNAELRLAVVGYTPGQQPPHGIQTPLNLHWSAQERDLALSQGIGITQDVTMPEGVDSVRLIVFDRGSDTVGSVTMPVPQNTPGKPK